MIGKAFGPMVAGLFLAFPAILPAGITLVAEHEDKEAAGKDALGAAIGSVGLAAFGAILWAGNSQVPAWVTLAGAIVAWLVVGAGLWLVVQEVRNKGGG